MVSGQKFHPICQICVQKNSYLKMEQTFENTTFRFVKLSAVMWASSDRNQTSSTPIYSWLTNWSQVKRSVKTIKFRSCKFYLQKLKMKQRLGHYDFVILFGILTQYLNSESASKIDWIRSLSYPQGLFTRILFNFGRAI